MGIFLNIGTAIIILLCYFSMIIYRELFSQKPLKVLYVVVPLGLLAAAVVLLTFFNGSNGIFSQFIYPAWFFELIGYIEIYFILMIPMFFGTIFLDNRRKAWSAMIFPGAISVYFIALLNESLFYEMGWLVFCIMLLYLTWGLLCTFTPRLVWTYYVNLRDKLGGKILRNIVVGIVAGTFAVVICTIAFTIAVNINKSEADYLPPHMINPPTTIEYDIDKE